MPEIRLQFSAQHTLSSWLIRFASLGDPKLDVSHVDYVDPRNGGWLLGARHDWVRRHGLGDIPPGVRLRPPGYRTFSRIEVMTVPCTNKQSVDFGAYLVREMGLPYNDAAIIGFGLHRSWGTGGSAEECAQLMIQAGQATQILPTGLYEPSYKITPVECALVYSAVGGIIVAN